VITVLLLRDLLENIGIRSKTQDGYKSGINVGFYGGIQSAIDLFSQEPDFEIALLIRDFIVKNKS
jgi:hypothetical protein